MWRCRTRGLERCARGVLAAALLPATAVHATGPSPAAATTLLALRLNGVEQAGVVPVLHGAAGPALQRQTWDQLGLRGGERFVAEGHTWHSLASLRWHIDEPTQTLVIEAPPGAFAGASLQATRGPAAEATVLPPGSGAFFNYELLWQRGRGGTRDSAGGFVEGHAFSAWGTVRSSALLRGGGGSAESPRALRLDTTYTHDDPARLASLRVGDSIGSGGSWGRPHRFGGLHWASDFSLQPGFTAFPLPTLRGEAALPSTVELVIDQSRRVQGSVPAGPFEINELPVVNGMGEMRLVVRDLLGREQVLTVPYHTSAQLLRPGLVAHSFELGAERLAWGSTSGHYGRATGAATWREGISDTHTREWRAEFISRQFTAGAGGAWLLPGLGTLQAAAAGSQSPGQLRGAMATLQAQHQSRAFSAGLHLRLASRGFRQLGSGAAGEPRRVAGASLGTQWAGWGLGASLLAQQPREAQRQHLVSLNAVRGFGRWGTLALSALHDRNRGGGGTVAAASFSIALGSGQTLGLSSTGAGQPGARHDSLAWQLAPPPGSGWGAQLAHERWHTPAAAPRTRSSGQWQWRLDAVALDAAVAHSPSGTDTRLAASGGFGWLGDTPFASRRIDGSFALVQVADLEGVTVLHEHRPVARTDAQGRAWVPGLRGHEVNRIGVDAADLPLDISVGALEQLVVPPARSGVLLSLPLVRSRSAQFQVQLADGSAPPPGSAVLLLPGAGGGERASVLGFEGRAFLSGLAAHNEVVVRWPGRECRFALVLADAGGAAAGADLGALRCR
jgi:outer membrane usher protein